MPRFGFVFLGGRLLDFHVILAKLTVVEWACGQQG
jgi:hypothetical protein